jgi:hypothetical protein
MAVAEELVVLVVAAADVAGAGRAGHRSQYRDFAGLADPGRDGAGADAVTGAGATAGPAGQFRRVTLLLALQRLNVSDVMGAVHRRRTHRRPERPTQAGLIGKDSAAQRSTPSLTLLGR